MRICVFSGSSAGYRAEYAAAARALALALVERGIGIVYGGGSVGLMGVLADTALAAGGEVVGVIPRPLASRELAHAGLTELRVVSSMHERKALMASLADGFIALPGGLGTLEETLEILTWAQLGIHDKPVGVLNVGGYYDGLRRLLGHGVEEGFIRKEHAAFLLFADTAPELLGAFAAWQPPTVPRAWLDPTQT
ncbi:MAG TPA: TIGR00730 family Rossman fold protein [Methylomirabilota bacterium]